MGLRISQLRRIGPAFILASVVIGPGSITLSTMAGSLYGYRLLWVLVLATLFMIAFTWMAARLALITRKTLFQSARERYGARVSQVGGFFGFLAILSFQAGNSAAIGFSANAAVEVISPSVWSVFFAGAAILFIFQSDLIRKLEWLVKLVTGLMVIGFLGTLLLVGVDASAFGLGLIPSFPDRGSIFLGLGMAATTFSIAAAVYQNYLMREKGWGPDELSTEGLDTFLGIGILGLISMVVLMTSAAVIRRTSLESFTAQTMAQQLEPLAGPAAYYLFVAGFFFASLSSLIINPIVGATLLADGLGKDPSMKHSPVRVGACAVLVLGTVVVLIFDGPPVELLRLAQALAVVAFPVLGALLLLLTNDRALMGSQVNGKVLNVIGTLGYLTILGICLNYIRQILGLEFS